MLIYDYNDYDEITESELMDLKNSGALIKYSDFDECYINCNTSEYGYFDGDLVTNDTIEDRNLKYCEDTEDYQEDYVYLEDKEYYVSQDYNYYWCCDECGCYYSDSTEYHVVDGYYYCEECYEEHKPVIYDYHDYNDGYYPRSYPNDKPLYLGFELEVDHTKLDNIELARRVLDGSPDNVLHCEYDASVEFEFISQPCTLAYHKKQEYQDWFFNELIGNCESHDAGTCGLHVHVNKEWFDEKGYERLKTILFFFKEELFKFSRRQAWDYQYSNFEENIAKKDITIKGSKNCKKAGHYTWFNENSRNTYEFRFFRGTLKFSTFMATLELVNNICMLAMSDKTVITWEDLINPGDYCKDYSDSRGIDCSDVLDFAVLEERENKQMKELEAYLDKYAFMIESRIIFVEIIDDYIYTYSPYMLDTGKVTRKAFERIRIDKISVDIMSRNGYSELCDRNQLSILLGGAF